MNGEIIHMSSWMNCMFETDILDKASPATVGRCGMVYMDTNNLGWRPLKESFLAELPRVSINEEHVENLDELFEWLIQPCLDMVKQQGTFKNYLFEDLSKKVNPIPTMDREWGPPHCVCTNYN